jgi:hypothetical protein
MESYKKLSVLFGLNFDVGNVLLQLGYPALHVLDDNVPVTGILINVGQGHVCQGVGVVLQLTDEPK